MSSSSQKRKRCSEIKNNLVGDLQQLSIMSMDYNSQIQAANEDFKSYFKAMMERHSELYAHSTNLDKRYR